jgi:nicotinamide-nucleotide amidase
MDADLVQAAARLIEKLRERKLRLAVAESCTGGLIAAALTEVPGASHVFACGFVAYANAAKSAHLGVPAAVIARHGAVSKEVARLMAEGALLRAPADVAVAVTGIAGPGGGGAGKPVGLVHVAAARKGAGSRHKECRFGDIGRAAIRLKTVAEAFALIEALIQD